VSLINHPVLFILNSFEALPTPISVCKFVVNHICHVHVQLFEPQILTDYRVAAGHLTIILRG
jgi:hypothetical protein